MSHNKALFKTLWLVTLLPLLLAWAIAYWSDYLTLNTKNNGTLLPAGIFIPADLSKQYQGKWALLVVSTECPLSCQQQLYRMQQLHKLLGQNYPRLQTLWLSEQATSSTPAFTVDIDFTSIQKIHDKALLTWFQQSELAQPQMGIWLIDPNGMLVLFFPATLSGKQILTDIEWLLKASRIG